ncbi:hypothetical protein B0H14DRAFT_3426756 [Mycena olivaceomarginata]|nr:hypothetical protein B0H14DRAFT_3426756 [Mycena olivaceomarginata]
MSLFLVESHIVLAGGTLPAASVTAALAYGMFRIVPGRSRASWLATASSFRVLLPGGQGSTGSKRIAALMPRVTTTQVLEFHFWRRNPDTFGDADAIYDFPLPTTSGIFFVLIVFVTELEILQYFSGPLLSIPKTQKLRIKVLLLNRQIKEFINGGLPNIIPETNSRL